jgi:hypothetical protein
MVRRHRGAIQLVSILRLNKVFGPNGRIPVPRSSAYANYIARPGGPENITGTSIRRLRLTKLGPRAVGIADDEVNRVVNELIAASAGAT